jgi:segregation and condensation protein A
LIKKQEVDIYDIPIAQITQQYLDYIRMLEFLNLELAGEFLVMAATLMRIKARLLLPVRSDDEEDELDPRQELVQQLLEYQKYKAAATELEAMEYQRRLVHARPEPAPDVAVDVQYSYNLFDLISAFREVLEKARVRVMEVSLEETSIEERIEYLKGRIAEQEVIAFQDLFEQDSSVRQLVATFLALLEVLRQGLVTVKQAKAFGQIWIHRLAKETSDGGT